MRNLLNYMSMSVVNKLKIDFGSNGKYHIIKNIHIRNINVLSLVVPGKCRVYFFNVWVLSSVVVNRLSIL